MDKSDPNNIEYKLSQLLDGDLSPAEEAELLEKEKVPPWRVMSASEAA